MTSDPEFEDWCVASYGLVLRAVTGYFGHTDVEDSVHDAFVRAYVRWSDLRDKRSPTAWTIKVAINRQKRVSARDARRRDLERTVSTNSTAGLAAGADRDLWNLVRQLPSRQREAIVLRYVEDLTQLELAVQMQVAPGTAAATLYKARKQLLEGLRIE